MFFWLIAIPLFVIVAMFTLFKLPSNDLNKSEDIQDTAMAFRMALQHDAAAKLMQEYHAYDELDMFNEGHYDLGGDTWKETILGSGYLPSSFIPDTDNITTYIRCVNGLREISSCRDASGIYMITAATPPSSNSITARWFEQKGAINLASQLKKYEGSFPVKPNVALPRKPRKEQGESDEAFAIRLNDYYETKKQYKLLKRNYYDFGNKLPRPATTVGQVRAFPFNDTTADSRVIVQRIKAIDGDVVFDKEYLPTDLPTGIANNEAMDFNGEAVIFSKSSLCNEGLCACTIGTDCGIGVYCQAAVCSASCGGYGADENRTCYTTCSSDSQCPTGYSCNEGVCLLKNCLTYLDCPISKPYCNSGECSATQIITCNPTSTMPIQTWIEGWANCTSCPEGTFKRYQSVGDTEDFICDYPIAPDNECVNIPSVNDYVILPTGYYMPRKRPGLWWTYDLRSDIIMWRRQVNITCNGKNEEWDLIGPFITWWEAQEVCAKLGKTPPANTGTLTGGCSEGARWSLIANATAVGTGQTLTDVSGISSDWDDLTRNWHWIYTQQPFRYDYPCYVWDVDLATGEPLGYAALSSKCFDTYILCGPAQ